MEKYYYAFAIGFMMGAIRQLIVRFHEKAVLESDACTYRAYQKDSNIHSFKLMQEAGYMKNFACLWID